MQPSRRRHLPSDARARNFAWACWATGFVTALVLVVANGRNVPMREDWQLVPAMTGHQNDLLSWLWSENNQHRLPVPRLVYLGLLKIWPDFRVGMVFNILLLAAIAAAFLVFTRRMRGRTRWTDAFFPVALLGLGNWENMGWGWEMQFVIATALACGVLLGSASTRKLTTARAAGLGACLVGVPLTGATALPFAPLVAVALIPRARRARGSGRVVLTCSIALTLLITVVYFVGLRRPSWESATAGVWATLETAAKLLALGAGPAAGLWWFVSAFATIAFLAGAAVVLYRTRASAKWPLLAFLLAGFVLAIEIGYSRAELVPSYGLPDRYALIALPVLCCAYIAYDQYAGRTWKRLGPRALFATTIILLPLNIALGFQFRDWYHSLVDPFASDVKAGVPLSELGYYGSIGDDPEWVPGMVDLHQAHLGVFSQLRVDGGPPPAGRRVDTLDGGGEGWSTLGGTASLGSLAQSGGHQVLQWDYKLGTGIVPALGRSFDPPQDWRQAGAIAVTLDGQGSGRTVAVRVVTVASSQGIDSYEATFADSQAGAHTVVIPWSGFLHVNSKGQFDLQGPMPLQHVRALVFGITGQGDGRLVIERVSLEPGHYQWGWPRHPAATRHSLPPWS